MNAPNDLQILDDIEAAQERWNCEIERVTAELLVREVAALYLNFERLLNLALDNEGCLSEDQRHAYKYVLGREFSRRMRKLKLIKKRGRDA